MKKRIFTAAVCAVVAMCSNINAQTDEKDTVFVNPNPQVKYDSLVNLDPVVISSNQMAVPRRNAPTMVGIVDGKLLDMTNSVCMADALSYQNGVRVEDNCASCGYKQARINGLDGHYTQILLDSRPVFSAVSNFYGLEQVPANMIDRIELIRSGGSALYGASAVGGTINIITKQPTGNSSYVGHSITSIGTGNSLDNVTSFNSSVVNSEGTGGILLFGQNRMRDGYSYYDDGYTTLPQLKVFTVGTKMYFKPTDFSKLDISYYLMKDDREGGNKFKLPVERRNLAETASHTLHNATVNYHITSQDNRIHLNIFSSLAAVNRNSYSGGFSPDTLPDINAWKYHSHTRNITYNGGAAFRYRFDRFLFLPAYLTLGSEYTGDFIKDEFIGFNTVDRQNAHVESFYLQNEWTDDKWNILVGARLDKHNMIKKAIFSPRLNVKYSPFKSLDLRFSYSEGFRAPQIFGEDLHVSMAGGERFVIRLKDDLKEERSKSFSLSADAYCNVGRVQMNFMAEGFYTKLSDVFVLNNTEHTDGQGNNIIERYNGSGAEYYGISMEWRTKYKALWETSLGFTLQKSRYDELQQWSDNAEGTQRVLRTPDSYGYLTLEYYLWRNFHFDITGTYTGSMLCPHMEGSGTDVDRLEETPSFFDMNIKMTYTVNFRKNMSFDLSCGMLNIFNQYQNDFDKGFDRDSDYIYGPSLPRSLIFSCSMKF